MSVSGHNRGAGAAMRDRRWLIALLVLVGIGYMTLLVYLSFVNWKASIFLLLLAIATSNANRK